MAARHILSNPRSNSAIRTTHPPLPQKQCHWAFQACSGHVCVNVTPAISFIAGARDLDLGPIPRIFLN